MQHFEGNEIKIADYFDGKMNAIEEEAFMQQLSVNAALRQQYEDELMLRGLFGNEKDELITEDDGPNEGENNVTNFQEAAVKTEEKSSSSKLFFLGKFRNIAAAILVIISIAIVFKLVISKNKAVPSGEEKIAKITPAKIDSIPEIDSGNIAAQRVSAENIFKKYYTTYSGQNEPVEISNYYNSYKKGEYQSVVSARESDYQTMGINDRNDVLKQYMNLYKGLSYLGQSKSDNAIEKFDLLLQQAAKKSGLYYEAQWYKALTWLRKDESAKAAQTLSLIMNSASPYKNKATALSKELAAHNLLSK